MLLRCEWGATHIIFINLLAEPTRKPGLAKQNSSWIINQKEVYQGLLSHFAAFLLFTGDVKLCMCVCLLCVSRLRLMCRKQSEQLFTYKPLGVLKRSSVVRPTCGERDARYHDNAAHLPLLWLWHLVTRSHWLKIFAVATGRLGLRQWRRAIRQTWPGASEEEDGARASCRKWSVLQLWTLTDWSNIFILFVVGMFISNWLIVY